MAASKVLKVNNSIELSSYIIGQMNLVPGIGEIALPTNKMSLAQIGETILDTPAHRNAFYNVINQLAGVVMTRSYYDFPYGWMLKDSFTYGEGVEEVDCDIVDPIDYRYAVEHPEDVLSNYIPDVKSIIHPVNMAKIYPVTINYNDASYAFQSEDGLFSFIDMIAEKLYESAKIDLFFLIKYLIQKRIISGTVAAEYIDGYDNMESDKQIAAIKGIINRMIAPTRKYNPAGLMKGVNFKDMTLIIDGETEANMSTLTLAKAFNRSDADFQTSFAMIDDWTSNDFDRLAKLIPDVEEFTQDEKNLLSTVKAFCSTRDWWQIRDKDIQFNAINTNGGNVTEFENPLTLTKNRFLHVQRILATSPFQPAFFVTAEEPTVTSVTVAPSELDYTSVPVKVETVLTAAVVTTGGANKSVFWSVDDTASAAGVSVDITGKITIPANYEGEFEVTATSVFDSSKKDTATITVTATA